MLKRMSLVLPGILLLISCTVQQSPVAISEEKSNLVDPNGAMVAASPVLSTTTTEALANVPTTIVDATTLPTATGPTAATDTPTPATVPTATPPITPVPSPTATWTSTPAPVVVANQPINVRSGPGLMYAVISALRSGQGADIVGRNPEGDWWQIRIGEGDVGWVFGGVVKADGDISTVAVAPNIPAPPPTPTPAPPAATPSSPTATFTPITPPAPTRQAVVELGPDTNYPVRADHIIGWGYELVDASEQWDILLHRDVFGFVAHEFWGDKLYGPHPQGIRITFLDCESAMVHGTGEVDCAGTEAPIALFMKDHGLGISYGDGVGSMIAADCANESTNYHDPQACFIGLGPVDAGHLTDSVVSAVITAQNLSYNFYGAETPDFRQAPFTPHLGTAVRDDALQQWRWQNPFLEIVPANG